MACNDNPYQIPADIDTPASRQVLQSINWQVMNLTTSSNMFHALRRQLYREFREANGGDESQTIIEVARAASSSFEVIWVKEHSW